MQDKNKPRNPKIEESLKLVKNKLLIFSGKGGVGKSTVAANLAFALSEKGLKVGLLDIDIHGPSQGKMLNVENRKVQMIDGKIIPLKITENLKLISMAFFIENTDSPVVWRGPIKMKIIQQMLEDTEWGELDWLICDSPPGTGDEPLSFAHLIPATAAIIVTTPQDVSLLDSTKAISFAKLLNLNLLGVIENMSGFRCPHCNEKIDIFKSGGGQKIAKDYNIPFLGKIPLDPHIVESGDSGQPFAAYNKTSEAAEAFSAIVEQIIK